MGAANSGPSKRVVVDALVLACSHSRIRGVVGTDALRSVLDVEYLELTRGGTFDLQSVWELFQDQPGFDAQAAAPPMCRFKSWQNQLGIEITLPEALRDLSEMERTRLAGECDVPTHAQKKILRSADKDDAGATGTRKAASRTRTISQEITSQKVAPRSGRRAAIQAAAAVIGLAGFAFAGFSAYQSCATPAQFQSLSLAFAGELPIEDAERLGDQVKATLRDPGWLSKAEDARRSELEAAVRKLWPQGVTVLYLEDQAGRVRAVAQLYDDGQRIRFDFK